MPLVDIVGGGASNHDVLLLFFHGMARQPSLFHFASEFTSFSNVHATFVSIWSIAVVGQISS